ncbi:hypothetical protein A4A49_52781 [Nicotiana attenuata]|uniref:Uncharacterized protein n=1 Tax=Nicotiana attenuata TaxID=49451 RepID=A0A1J6J1V9_NICAT|nr:hypothetical protein A4A49_52781 [Nicotiana attenuata]
MNSLVRSRPLRFSRRIDGYEPLDQSQIGKSGKETEIVCDDDHSQYRRRNISMKLQRIGTRKQQIRSPIILRSLSYRRERARKRQIFLQSYKLESIDNSRTKILKKIVFKVNSAIVSVASFMWTLTPLDLVIVTLQSVLFLPLEYKVLLINS